MTVSTALPRNRELDPVRVRRARIVHTASCNRVSWVGAQVIVVLRNGDEVACEHTSGHRVETAVIRCATALVARLNIAAGTTSAQVDQERNRG